MALATYFNQITVDKVKELYAKKNYKLYSTADYNVNIFGIRSTENKANTFNDVVGILYKVKGVWVLKKYEATVDPGLYYRQNPINANGTAIIQPGYYQSVYAVGLHQNKYEALKQVKPIKYWRDNNKDGILDRSGKTYEEIGGTNIHRATAHPGQRSVLVDKWSAGCMVLSGYDDFQEFLGIVKRARDLYGNHFSFALFEESDL